MKAIHRIATTAALVAAIVSAPAPALAAEPVTIESLTSAAATATAEHESATAKLQALDTRLTEARAELEAIEAVLPSTPSEEFEAVGVAMGGLFSRRMAQRAEVIVNGLDERKDLEAEIAKLVSERDGLVEDVEETRKATEEVTAELQAAQAAAAAVAAADAERARAALAGQVRLMIDPGHGGKDPGAVSGATYEKDTNLQISHKVYSAAARQGWVVDMTRYDDRFIPLPQRPAIANAFGATALVSIHSNSGGPAARGNMTIFRSPAGASLGQQLMEEMYQLTPYDDIGNRGDVRGLAVLRGAAVPAVIVEVLSLSSPEELAQVVNPDMQTQYAESIVKGVADFHGIAYVPPTPAAPAAEAAPAPEVAAEPEADVSTEATTTPELDVPKSQEPGWLGNLLNLLVR